MVLCLLTRLEQDLRLLNVWRRYGILVLVIEMLGATTTLLYGLNILFDPVHEELPQDPENPGLTLVS